MAPPGLFQRQNEKGRGPWGYAAFRKGTMVWLSAHRRPGRAPAPRRPTRRARRSVTMGMEWVRAMDRLCRRRRVGVNRPRYLHRPMAAGAPQGLAWGGNGSGGVKPLRRRSAPNRRGCPPSLQPNRNPSATPVANGKSSPMPRASIPRTMS